MTTEGKQRAVTPATSQNGYASSRNGREGPAPDADLPDFITEILVQYKDLLVQHVDTVKNKAVGEVKEEALLLHSRAETRLRSMESELQQGVQAVLDRARETIFEMVRVELGEIFDEMETRLQTLLDTGESRPAAERDDEKDGVDESSEIASLLGAGDPSGTLADEEQEEKEAEDEERDLAHSDVRLELPPPLDPRHLLGFYRGLSNTNDVRILRALGSLDKGVNLYIRPKEPSTVTDLLRSLPEVEEVSVGDPSDSEKGQRDRELDTRLTLRIHLTAATSR